MVRFTSKTKLAAYRRKRLDVNVTHAGLKVEGVAERLFVNEDLTLVNKIIFKQARTFAKQKEYKYIWTQSGNFLVRMDDTSKIIHVT